MIAHTIAHPSAMAAIAFALDCLEPFEIRDYLLAWRRKEDLTPWVEAHEEDTRRALDFSTNQT
ncbi:MAG: hypothetical protein E5V86_03990 [Mesorhizobium sp.]|nr:MAG: hypothetical protein E5V86_03990 [Mesorhizobium sp.]